MIALTKVNRGELGQTFHYERALSIFEELGDLVRQGDVLNAYGIMAYWEGRWGDAVELYERGADRVKRAGDAVGPAIGWMNVAEIRSDQGRLDEAERAARDALRVFRAARYSEMMAIDGGILGRTLSRARRHDEAATRLSEALKVAEESGFQLQSVGLIGFIAEDQVRQGEADAALDHVERAESRAKLVGGPGVYEPLLERVRGCASLLRGELAPADEALAKSLTAGRAAGAEFEILLTLEANRALSEVRREKTPAIEEAEASSIADRLGIVTIPPLVPDGP
jgi:tetratricopeptide (TPR) repeat protein